MMHEYSTGELLARAVFTHHDDQRRDAIRHHPVLKGLETGLYIIRVKCYRLRGHVTIQLYTVLCSMLYQGL